MANVNRFMQRIIAMWTDPETPGWNVCQLECDHLTHQPKGNTNKSCHCGDCVLAHQKHMADLARCTPPKETPPDAEPSM